MYISNIIPTFAVENQLKRLSKMKTLELTQEELNCILFAINSRLNGIRGFHSYEEEHLESVVKKLLKIK